MLNIAKTIEILAKNITEQINQKIPNPIKHYAKDHQDVPMYVLINELTFGNVVYLFKIMQHAERAEIINIFNSIMYENLNDSSSKIFPNDFDKMLDNLLNLRNTTAHNSSLFTFKCRGNISYIKSLHERFNIAADVPKQDLYNIIITFACFLPKNDFRKLYNSILKRCKRLNQKLHTISPNQIYIKLGFPIGFYGYPKIVQN
jgi:abi-like protein